MRVLGISAGNGVMLHPFKEHVIGNIEVRSDYTIGKYPHQFHLNFPDAFYTDKLYNTQDPVDIVIGHPKCGQSSMLALSRGKTFKSHKDEPSLNIFIEGIQKYRPRLFLLENLPKLLDSYSMNDFAVLFPDYLLDSWIGSMNALGNSQKNRKRLIITGVRKTRGRFAEKARAALLHKFQMKRPRHTDQLLKDLPFNGYFRPPLDEIIALYGGTSMSYQDIKKLWVSLAPATRIKTPNESFSTAPGVYRDGEDKFPNTIRKSNRCFSPAGLSYTPRQRARIQGVPDEFLILDPFNSEHNEKTLFNKGCVTMGSTPCYEVAEWFHKVLKPLLHGL